jgi:plasmid maintenance system antidote protein VapI
VDSFRTVSHARGNPSGRVFGADTGLRLSRYFGMLGEFWTGLQLSYDQVKAKDALVD